MRLRRHAGENLLLPLIVADLSEQNLEQASLILTGRPHVTAVNTVRSYSGVHRSGMISVTGLSVRRQVTAHRHGVKRGARTSTVPNSDTNRRNR
jgi:hypothetical protein